MTFAQFVGSSRLGLRAQPGSDQAEASEDLPLIGLLVVIERQHRIAVVGDVADREAEILELAASHTEDSTAESREPMSCA